MDDLPTRATSRLQTVRDYSLALVLCALILTWSLRLWNADRDIPFFYSGDSLFTQLWIKAILENGWYLQNDLLGAPAGCDLHDFPMSDGLNFLVLKTLGYIHPDIGFVFNAYFLLTFPLATASSLFVLKRFEVSSLPAIVTSLLYTFLPYHFLRGMVGHLFLASYWLVPLTIMVALWTAGCKVRKSRLCAGIAICLLASSAGIYYALFAGFFIAIAGALAAFERRSFGQFRVTGLFIGTLAFGVIVNALPYVSHRLENGSNRLAVQRPRTSAEVYGLKINQMLMPPSFHRIAALAKAKQEYMQAMPQGSGDFWYLGFVGSFGFVYLLGRLLAKNREVANGLLHSLAIFTVFALLLAGVSGFGSVFSLVFGPWIRCYERMSIFIAFFSLLAVGFLLTRFLAKHSSITGQVLARSMVMSLLILGLLDQTSPQLVPAYEQVKQSFQQDEEFAERMEAMVPANSMIFQLPYVPFPENPPVDRMEDYQLLRPYLHSRQLRWSYGAIKGRSADGWLRETAALPPTEMLATLKDAGFAGIYIDRWGYADNCDHYSGELYRLIGSMPLISKDQRFLFFVIQ